MKLQTKKLLNYLFGLIFMGSLFFTMNQALVVNATGVAVSEDACTITGIGTATMQKTLTNDGTWASGSSTTRYYKMQFTNNSNTEKSVVVNFIINGGAFNSTLPEPHSCMQLESDDKCTGKISFILQPGESYSEKIIFYHSQKGTFNINASVSVSNCYPSSTDVNKPEILSPGAEQKGNGTATGLHYYSLTLNEDSAVKIYFSGLTNDSLRYSEGKGFENQYLGKNLYLKKGTYLFRVACGTDGSNEYALKCEVEPYNYGTVKMDWEGGNNQVKYRESRKYTLTYIPGTNFGESNESYICGIGKTLRDVPKEISKNTFVGNTDSNLNPGYHVIPYIVSGPVSMTTKSFGSEFVVLPVAPNKATRITGTHKSLNITYSVSEKNGKEFVIQCYKNGKWTTVKQMKLDTPLTFKVTKLKGNKSYKFRIYGIVPGENGKPAIVSDFSPVNEIRTAPSQKPVIKSIKVSDVKVKYIKKKYHRGNWSGGKWFKGYYTGGYYSTSYTVKVVLKKKVKGANGMVISYDTHKKGKGKTFTAKLGGRGKLRGKKKTISIRMCTTNPNVVGPKVSKKVTIK